MAHIQAALEQGRLVTLVGGGGVGKTRLALEVALQAGDDADDARWCNAQTLATLPIVTGLIEALTHWQCLPRHTPPHPY